jgi:hypothetical protein
MGYGTIVSSGLIHRYPLEIEHNCIQTNHPDASAEEHSTQSEPLLHLLPTSAHWYSKPTEVYPKGYNFVSPLPVPSPPRIISPGNLSSIPALIAKRNIKHHFILSSVFRIEVVPFIFTLLYGIIIKHRPPRLRLLVVFY